MWTKVVLIACITASLGMSQTAPPAPRIATGAVSFLGVAIQEIDSDRAKALKLPEEAGVEVTRIAPDSPAEKAGIKTGDIVTQYNGQRVEGMDQFSRMVRETPAGREARIGILRNGSAQTISAKIATRPLIAGQLVPPPTAPALQTFDYRFPDMPQSRMTWRSTILGIDVETLDGQLAEFFGVKEGVLVRMVNKDSAADKAGIRTGDVIVRLDDVKVATPADISAHLRAARGRPVSVSVVRDRKEITVMLAVAAGPDRSIGQWPESSLTELV
jgi:serine protease Do